MVSLPDTIHLGTIVVLLLLLPAVQSTVVLPKPSGPYNTRITTAELVDKTRLDPFAPNRTQRAIMVTVFYPNTKPSECDPLRTVNYMPLATAQFWDQEFSSYGITNATLENFRLSTVAPTPPSRHPATTTPTPSAMAATVASTGYVVLTIDHPHDAFIVEYPTGPPTYAANISSAAQTSLALATRASDVSVLLDQLGANDTVRDVIPGAARGLDVRRVAMYGHSFGGATAAAAMRSDHRIAGGLNMDGTFYGAVVERGLDRPFMLFSNPKITPNQTFYGDDSWAETWPRLRGWRRELALAGAAHNTFSDIPLLINLLGLSPFNATSVTGSTLGTIDGVRGFDVITAYVVAFLDFVLKGMESELLRMPSPLYPEVTLVR